MANKSFSELMESFNADLGNKKITETVLMNEAQEKHYLGILEQSYGTFMETFKKYMNSAEVAKHSDVKKLYEEFSEMSSKFNNIKNIFG